MEDLLPWTTVKEDLTITQSGLKPETLCGTGGNHTVCKAFSNAIEWGKGDSGNQPAYAKGGLVSTYLILNLSASRFIVVSLSCFYVGMFPYHSHLPLVLRFHIQVLPWSAPFPRKVRATSYRDRLICNSSRFSIFFGRITQSSKIWP